ncbi:MAG: hypothetical protein HC814_00430 [Rhodobacteraceae bacterium]|nr:hypothetical protein [Paracoccaceae bacterium]
MIGGTGPFLEDTLLAADIDISSADGGERLTGDVTVEVSGDPTASLFLSGALLTADAGTGGSTGTPARYTLAAADLIALEVLPTRDYSGPLTLTVTASTEDIDSSVRSGSATRTFDIEAVAEVPDFVYNSDPTPTDTGLPLVQDPTGALPIVSIIEDDRLFCRVSSILATRWIGMGRRRNRPWSDPCRIIWNSAAPRVASSTTAMGRSRFHARISRLS